MITVNKKKNTFKFQPIKEQEYASMLWETKIGSKTEFYVSLYCSERIIKFLVKKGLKYSVQRVSTLKNLKLEKKSFFNMQCSMQQNFSQFSYIDTLNYSVNI